MRSMLFGLLAAGVAWAQPSLSNLTVSWKQTFAQLIGYNFVVDTDGASYLFGRVDLGFIATNPPYGSAGLPSVVIKLDANGNTVWSTLLYANISTLAVDGLKNVYLAGYCDGSTFPTTPGAFQAGIPGTPGFVAKLNGSGRVEWATELGGNGDTKVSGIAVDASGVYVDGTTLAPSFPTTSGAFQQTLTTDGMHAPITVGFVSKFNPSGSRLIFSTFLGGPAGAATFVDGIAIDGAGAVYAAGSSSEPDFPVTAGAYKTTGRLFLTKLTANGSGLQFSTFVDDSASYGDLKIDTAGNSYVATRTPAKIVKIDATGRTALYARKIDTNGLTALQHVGLDTGGNAVVSGTTLSSDIAVPAPCFFDFGGSPTVATNFLLRLNSRGETIDGGYVPLKVFFGDPALFGLDSVGNVYTVAFGGVVGKFIPSPASAPVQLSCVGNSATLAKSPVAPGEILALFGDGIGPDQAANLQLDSSGKVASALADTRVQFDGMAAPIVYAQSRQINVVAPWKIAGRAMTRICVLYRGQTTNCITAPVSEVSPGLYRDAAGFVAALNEDGTINSQQNPARIGSIVTLYVTGTGPAVPPEADGEVNQDIRPGALAVKASMFRIIGVMVPAVEPVAADVIFHGPAPALVSGVEVVQIRVPANIDMADVELSMQTSTGTQYTDKAKIYVTGR